MRVAEKRCSNRLRTARRSNERTWASCLIASSSVSTIWPVTPLSTISGTDPQRKASTGVPQAMASIITMPNGSGQSTGNRRARAELRKFALARSLISPMNSNAGPLQHRLDLLAKIGFVSAVDLGCNLQRNAQGLGDPDGAVGPLFRRDAPK